MTAKLIRRREHFEQVATSSVMVEASTLDAIPSVEGEDVCRELRMIMIYGLISR